VVKELTEASGRYIVFIDELTPSWCRRRRGRRVDASNMLKPALARASCAWWAPPRFDEYRKHVEKDPALERRFSGAGGRASVTDPSRSCAGLKEKYEVHHGVRHHRNALVAAATLSARYIGDRFLPDKAIDLVTRRQPAAHGDRQPAAGRSTR